MPERQHNNEPEYIPSRAMIWAETVRIQQGWDETERKRRRGIIDPLPMTLEPVELGTEE